MKHLYWIDDDFKNMFYVAQGAIKKLWKLGNETKEGIHSKVILFGNEYQSTDKDELLTKEEEDWAFGKLYDLFRDSCMSIDGPNEKEPVFSARKELIQDSICFPFNKDVQEERNEYISMKKLWTDGNLDSVDSDDYKKAKEKADSLLEKVAIEPEGVVGIDIMLLYGDGERLKKKKLILSMELYHNLLSRGICCFLYSTYADDEPRLNWLKGYELFYGSKAEANIFQRSDLMQRGDADIVKAIENIFEKLQKNSEGKNDDNKGSVE